MLLSDKNPGFTLVELAIVISIIGLLIGGVLKGQEMLENARVTSTASQVKGYEAAVTTFRDIYKAIPGDSPQAANILEGCTGANGCVNGNGDGVLVTNISYYWQDYPTAINDERSQFWKHLALAKLVSGVSGSATALENGLSHPQSKINGIFLPMTMQGSSYTMAGQNYSYADGIGVSMRQNTATASWQCYTVPTACDVTPKQAWSLDIKMDDGIALRGNVQAISRNWVNGCGDTTNGPNGYTPATPGLQCDMLFVLGK